MKRLTIVLLACALALSASSGASSGNLLGNIVVPAAGSQNNSATATPFTIPFNAPYVTAVIDSQASGYSFRTCTGTPCVALSTDINQVGPATIQIPVNKTNGGTAQVVAFYNAGVGGTVKIYQSDGPTTSSTVPVIAAVEP